MSRSLWCHTTLIERRDGPIPLLHRAVVKDFALESSPFSGGSILTLGIDSCTGAGMTVKRNAIAARWQ
jgi:hypothetical protein